MTTPNPDIHGPFEQSVFLGASVVSWQEMTGWNEQTSSLNINLVEDPVLNQEFTEPSVGTPVYFEFPSPVGQTTPSDRDVHKFYGIVQSWERTNGSDGQRIKVSVIDPREILSGVQIILDGYVGDTGFVRNILNVYGFYEHQGVLNSYLFGSSGTTDVGMEWSKVKAGIQIMTSPIGIISPFGRRIVFRDTSYFVDLSYMPYMPDDYRISGGNIDLLSLITQVCQDSGHDFTVRLLYDSNLGNVIKINTISRRVLPVLGSIQTFIDDLPEGSFISSSIGRELRNEETNSVLVGGQVTALWSVPTGSVDNCGRFTEDEEGRNIWPFWGLDSYGNIVVGNEFGDEHYIELPLPNTLELTFNRPTYKLTVGEMRAVLGGQTEWEVYTQSIANKINFDLGENGTEVNLTILAGQIDKLGKSLEQLKNNPNTDVPQITSKVNQTQILTNQIRLDLDLMYGQLNEFVSAHYGKKFLVRLPVCNPADSCRDPSNPLASPCPPGYNTGVAYDSLTGDLITSWVPTDAGYLPAQSTTFLSVAAPGSAPTAGGPVQLVTEQVSSLLGLSQWGIDFFRVEDGRIQCLVVFNNVETLDLSDIPPDEYIIENGMLYLKATVEPDVVYVDRARGLNPYAVVTLNNTIKLLDTSYLNRRFFLLSRLAARQGVSIPGDLNISAQNKVAQSLLAAGGDTNFWDGAPEALRPIVAVVPLQSSNLTYGPWYWLGAVGKVRYEQDENLVPWNYGSVEAMNAAASRLVNERISYLQEAEMGYVQYAGIPVKNIGEELIADGPYIDSVSMDFSEGGFTTSYTFRTFTPAFGTLAKYNADKIKQLGTRTQKNSQYIRDLYKKMLHGLPKPEKQ